MRQKMKKLASAAVAGCLLSSMSLSMVKAGNFFDYYDFYLDFSTGDPYGYSEQLDKWYNEAAEASSNASNAYDFTATVLPSSDRGNVVHDNVVLYPGEDKTIEVPWYGSNSSKAVLRGESNHDVYYYISGWWASDPSYVYPE